MIYAPSDTVAAAVLDGETTLLEPTRGLYFGLDAVGTRVWEHLPASVDTLVGALCEEFDVEPEVCRVDVEELLEALVERALVVRIP